MVFRGKFREGLWVGSRARSGKQADSSCVGLQHILLKETPSWHRHMKQHQAVLISKNLPNKRPKKRSKN